MKSHRMIRILALSLCLLAAGQALAEKLQNEPGYIDLEWIDIPSDAEEIQDIDLGPVLLGVATDAEESGDDELAKALSMIRSIRVKAYSLDEEGDKKTEQAVDKIAGLMAKNDWNRLIYMKDDEQTMTVSTKYADGDLSGLMLVVYEPGEQAAFVNVVGDLDLATLLGIAKNFDTDQLGEYLEKVEHDN